MKPEELTSVLDFSDSRRSLDTLGDPVLWHEARCELVEVD